MTGWFSCSMTCTGPIPGPSSWPTTWCGGRPRLRCCSCSPTAAGRARPRLTRTLSLGVETGAVARIELGPLSPAESAELARRELTGAGLDDRARADICAESGGNPLYLLAAAATWSHVGGPAAAPGPLAAGSWPQDGRPAGAPARLEAVLRAELAELTGQESAVAAAGAVLGDQFRIDALPAVAGLDEPAVAGAVAVLTCRDVLRAAPIGGMLAFRHPVLRRVVYRSRDPAWRAAAHRRALAGLTRRGAPAAELAHHVAASPGRDVRADVSTLLSAAHDAMSSAPATAAHWLRAALEMLPADPAHAARRLEILLLLTRALGVAGRPAESRDLLHEILSLVPLEPAGPRVAAVTFCATMERLLTRYPEARAQLAAELASPRAAGSAEGVALAIEYGTVALLSADYPSARGELAAALAHARRRSDRTGTANALATTGFGEIYEGNVTAASGAIDASAALADTLSDGELSADPECLSRLGWAEFFLERFADAQRHFARGIAITRHIGHYHVLPHLLLGQCMLRCFAGSLTEAIALSEEAEEIARHIDSDDVLGLALALRAFATAWAGGPESGKRAVDLAEQAVDVIPQASVWWSKSAAICLALALLLSGDPARSVQVLTEAGGGAALPLLQPSMRPAGYDLLAGAAVLSGDGGAARGWSQRGNAEAERLGLSGQRGYAQRSRGYVLAAAGRHAEAAGAFRAAASLFGSAGMQVGRAWALAFGAPSAVAADSPGTGLEMAAEASALATAAGAGTILDAAQDTMRSLAASEPGRAAAGRSADPLGPLTRREREIARLAATGRTSRDIAAQLSLSPRTVDTHLSRVYRKLSLPSRAALASLVADRP